MVARDLRRWTLPRWRALVDARTQQHFKHLGVTLVDEASAARFRSL